MKPKIFLSPPHMSGLEHKYISEAFEANYIAPEGKNVVEFERDIEHYLGGDRFAVALNSGTSAIHLALILLGIEKNDEVICQTNTFIATANPILYQAATPVFIDSENETYNMCPKLLEEAIRDRIEKGKLPKAIILVHIYGMPCKFDEINEISNQYGIPIIEDSAEALGSKYKGRKCGSLGKFGIFSFNGNKIITTSGGGALITPNTEMKEKAIYYSNQAKQNSIDYSHTALGYNYRMSNILAGIGRGQMQVIEKYVSNRRNIYGFYKNSWKNFEFLNEPKEVYSNRWLTTALMENKEKRNKLMQVLEKENIESRPMWKPMHKQPIFKNYPCYLNGVSEDLNERGICLPSGSNLSEQDLHRIKSAIDAYIEENE